MTHVLTLIAPARSNTAIAATAVRLQRQLGTSEPVWLSPEEACDLYFTPADPALSETRAAVAAAVEGAGIDAAVQPRAGRRKRLLVADMDSTIIGQECLDEIAAMAGIGSQVAVLTERAMRGELPFEAALKERIGMLCGFPLSKLRKVLDERVTLTPGAETLARTMAANGARCVLVSGGFTFFTGAVAARAGFHAHYGNSFVIRDDAIAGVEEPILGREAKLATLYKEAAALNLPLSETMAVGDGANDLAMLQAAGLGVAFHAKPAVAAAASAQITHGDLTALLFLQGYKREEFATAKQP